MMTNNDKVALLRALYHGPSYHRLRAAPGACLWLRHGSTLRAVSLRDVVSPFGWLRHGSALRVVSLRDLTA